MSEKPESIKKALVIFWCLLSVEFIRSLITQYNHGFQDPLTTKIFYSFLILFIYSLNALLIFFIAKRKKWAGWLYLIVTLIKISSVVNSLIVNIEKRSILGLIDLIQIFATLAACLLLFSSSSRAWFNNQKDDENRKANKGRTLAIAIIMGLFIITLPFLGSLYLLAGVVSFQAIHAAIFDEKSDSNSDKIGKEVHLVPFTVLTKMKNYGGWTDEYNYIFANKPELNNPPRLNEYKTFKVIDEKTKAAILNPTKKICIIEDVKNKNLKASIYCEDIPRINEATKVITELSNEIKTRGKAYVASTADRRHSDLKSVLKINDFIVFEINNEEELKELVAPNDDQNESYEYIMRFDHLIPLKEAEVFDEHAQSKIFLHYFGGYWNDGLYGYSSFESYIKNNITPPDMEKWIIENHSNSRDRWAIRSIISIIQQAIFFEKKMDAYRATEFVKGLEESKECVAKYYSTPDNVKIDIDKAINKFFEKEDRRMAFNRIKKKVDHQYGSALKPCYHFFPPVVCGGEEKCENWTR